MCTFFSSHLGLCKCGRDINGNECVFMCDRALKSARAENEITYEDPCQHVYNIMSFDSYLNFDMLFFRA